MAEHDESWHMSRHEVDEIVAINSIFCPDTLVADGHELVLTMPGPGFKVRLQCERYPEQAPQVVGLDSVGALGRKSGGEILAVVRDSIEAVFEPHNVCMFDLLDRLEGSFGSVQTAEVADEEESQEPFLPGWSLSDPVSEKKSVFLARACRISESQQGQEAMAELMRTDRKVARATHNIIAYRVREGKVEDCNDDGESGAGRRVLHLLERMEAWDVFVVVSRWYGGVHLGPDRFRLINQAAQQAIVRLLSDSCSVARVK